MKNSIKLSAIVIFFLLVLMFIGCAFKSMHDTVEDPVKSEEIEDELKTQEDIDYWNRVKKNNESAIIILGEYENTIRPKRLFEYRIWWFQGLA